MQDILGNLIQPTGSSANTGGTGGEITARGGGADGRLSRTPSDFTRLLDISAVFRSPPQQASRRCLRPPGYSPGNRSGIDNSFSDSLQISQENGLTTDLDDIELCEADYNLWGNQSPGDVLLTFSPSTRHVALSGASSSVTSSPVSGFDVDPRILSVSLGSAAAAAVTGRAVDRREDLTMHRHAGFAGNDGDMTTELTRSISESGGATRSLSGVMRSLGGSTSTHLVGSIGGAQEESCGPYRSFPNQSIEQLARRSSLTGDQTISMYASSGGLTLNATVSADRVSQSSVVSPLTVSQRLTFRHVLVSPLSGVLQPVTGVATAMAHPAAARPTQSSSSSLRHMYAPTASAANHIAGYNRAGPTLPTTSAAAAVAVGFGSSTMFNNVEQTSAVEIESSHATVSSTAVVNTGTASPVNVDTLDSTDAKNLIQGNDTRGHTSATFSPFNISEVSSLSILSEVSSAVEHISLERSTHDADVGQSPVLPAREISDRDLVPNHLKARQVGDRSTASSAADNSLSFPHERIPYDNNAVETSTDDCILVDSVPDCLSIASNEATSLLCPPSNEICDR